MYVYVYVWRDPITYGTNHSSETWLIHMWHASLMCDMTSHMLHDSLVLWVIHKCDSTHISIKINRALALVNESWRTGRRRLIGSPKLQIIFHKRTIKYRSLLRIMTYKDKGSYESSPPCIVVFAQMLSNINQTHCNILHHTATVPRTEVDLLQRRLNESCRIWMRHVTGD